METRPNPFSHIQSGFPGCDEAGLRPHNRGIFQMTHMTAARGALKHDDRIDVLALAVDYWKAQMDADVEKAEAKHRERNLRTPMGHSQHLLNRPGRAQGRRMG